MSSSIILVLGGVRSGKSGFAEKLVREMYRPTVYLATGQVTDAEMAERIRRHQESRPANWTTMEEPLELAEALMTSVKTDDQCAVLLDSLDTWVSNLVLKHESLPTPDLESLALSQVDQLLAVCQQQSVSAVMVSSEVGHSLVPPNELGRRFQDLLGLVNQRVARSAGQVYLVVAGIPMEIKNITKDNL